MVKVITYGTFDLFHQGHYNLLKRAKELGDYLIVGVTSESFDKNRGKLNVRDSLIKRIENVRQTGFADEIIVEEYIGQKIDDIKKYHINIFTVGSDWTGHFDYLNEYCKVQYLERTLGVSSTEIRNKDTINIGIVGAENIVSRFCDEAKYVSGINLVGIYDVNERISYVDKISSDNNLLVFTKLDEMLKHVDAVYICCPPKYHFDYCVTALNAGKHVMCEFPFCLKRKEAQRIYEIANKKSLIVFHALKTAYAPAFQRLVSLAKTGIIGNVLAVEANFTQILGSRLPLQVRASSGGSVNALSEYPMLAFIKLLGSNYKEVSFFSHVNRKYDVDVFTKMYLQYEKSIATATIAIDAKSEGSMTITGTKGYFYVPAPWWKTEYFEARFEDINQNMKYFYKFQGEGLRYEIAEFSKCVINGEKCLHLTENETLTMTDIIERYNSGIYTRYM